MTSYDKYLECFADDNPIIKEIFSDVLTSIFPEKVYCDYQKMVELLKQYNFLVGKLLNYDGDYYVDKIGDNLIDVNEKNKYVIQKSKNSDIYEQKIADYLKKYQNLVNNFSVSDLHKIDLLKGMTEKLTAGMIQLNSEKQRLDDIKKRAENKYEDSLNSYYKNENKLNICMQEIKDIVFQISEQIIVLEKFVDLEGKQRIENIKVKPEHISQMQDKLKMVYRDFGVPVDFINIGAEKITELFCSYLDLKKVIFRIALPTAKKISYQYNNRTEKLKKYRN